MSANKQEMSEIGQKRMGEEKNSPPKKKKPNHSKSLESLSQTVKENYENIQALSALPLALKEQTSKVDKLLQMFENHGPAALPQSKTSQEDDDEEDRDDPIKNLISTVGSTDKSALDQLDDVIVIENPMIEEILNANQVEDDYGPSVDEKIAAAFKRVISQTISKDKIDKNKTVLKVPENVKEMKAPKVNPEIWSQLPKKAQASDASQQFVQQFISRGLVAQSSTASLLANNASKIPPDLLKDLLSKTMEAATEFGAAHKEISLKRRHQIKPFLAQESAGICGSSVPVTENLFGNKDLTSVRTSAKIVKNLSPSFRGGFGRGSFNRGTFSSHQPQSPGFRQSLNWRGPPLRARGGRRPFRGRFQSYQQN